MFFKYFQVFGKYPWLCGKIWTEEDAPWVTVAATHQMPRECTRCWSRTLSAITPPTGIHHLLLLSLTYELILTNITGHLSHCTTTLLGSRQPTTRKVSKLSLILSSPWTTSGWSRIGKPFNGYEILLRWIASRPLSHSTVIIRSVRNPFKHN